MANPSYFQDNPDAWGHSTFNGTGQHMKSYDGERDKYFTKGKDGQYVLKDGYEQREQRDGSNSMGAEVTYSNTSSDHDDFETTVDHYGIYKKAQAEQVQTPHTPAEIPKKEVKDDMVIKSKGPTKYSPEIQQAKERVSNFQSMASGYENASSSQQSFDKSGDYNTSKYEFNPRG